MTIDNAPPLDPGKRGDDVYTMEARLCDDNGMVSDERVAPGSPGTAFDPDLTYLKLLNNLRAQTARLRGDGRFEPTTEPFHCTGSAHHAGEHIRCTSPAHERPAVAVNWAESAVTASAGRVHLAWPSESEMQVQQERLIDMRAALAGYDAQYGDQSIGEQHPELPRGCVERVESVVNALRTELVREQRAQWVRLGVLDV